jgi:hypothetical protein
MKKSVTKLRKKHGIWVCRSGKRVTQTTVNKIVRKIRKERDNQILGKSS